MINDRDYFPGFHTRTINGCRMIDVNDIIMEIISLAAITVNGCRKMKMINVRDYFRGYHTLTVNGCRTM
jgi:hypothetical protein